MAMYIPNMKPEQFYGLCKKHGLEIIAVPVPPHGMLIDADELTKEMRLFIKENMLSRDDARELTETIADAPTVIEAEEVHGQYTDTAGNLHWCGTHSSEHKSKAEED